ncbi:DUF6377 domain-containing protein [Persicobacter psychrovividus]|uniref:DUF6377 domain-containing protein n=1 Tax=Persicobacter psychrovividus TaxID=387638 RepID=A0ABM7VIG9_9BACT|nr:hypothetical protein PEPS_28500 [Persicobacter psychrovividus]
MNKQLQLFFLLLCPVLMFSPVQAQSSEELLPKLLEVMDQQPKYELQKLSEIGLLKQRLERTNHPMKQYWLYREIGLAYEAFVFDSAMVYVQQANRMARQIKDPNSILEAQLDLAMLLAVSGRPQEALNVVKRTHSQTDNPEIRLQYLKVCHKIYGDLWFYGYLPEEKKRYEALHLQYGDSVKQLASLSSYDYLVVQEGQYLDARQLMDCRRINTQILKMFDSGSRAYSKAAFTRSQSYELEQNTEKQKCFLIASAISDLKGAVKDNAAMATLAGLYFNEGRVELAYQLIKCSLKDAEYFNSKLRQVEVSNIEPLISAAYQLETERQKQHLRQMLYLTIFLIALICAALMLLYYQVRKVRLTKKKLERSNARLQQLNHDLAASNEHLNQLFEALSESDHIKEQYIGNFFKICSDYIDKLDEQRKYAKKLVSNKKGAQLVRELSDPDFLEEEIKAFYENFDRTFLKIYPNFVTEFNALMLPENQFEPKQGEQLNSELRIFALIRLGIQDSGKIAKLLRYSVHTIYNYRAKVKKKTMVPKENFEDEIMKIGTKKSSNTLEKEKEVAVF